MTPGLHISHLRFRSIQTGHTAAKEWTLKLLTAEDEPKTGSCLRQGLGVAGYVADLVNNGMDGLHLAKDGSCEHVVLDVMRPGMDGRLNRPALQSLGSLLWPAAVGQLASAVTWGSGRSVWLYCGRRLPGTTANW